eukprot:6191359-Pleurochrysis_carterae.AAC.15
MAGIIGDLMSILSEGNPVQVQNKFVASLSAMYLAACCYSSKRMPFCVSIHLCSHTLVHLQQTKTSINALKKFPFLACAPSAEVDDLLDVSALESYIEKSAVVLIFLSKGYFFSKNCLREVRCSEQNDKPLVLVNEADLSKGGIALKDSRAECPEDLRSFVFDDRAVIQYGAESQTQSNLCY